MEDAALSPRKETASTSRYERLVKIASGGMASVYVGRLRGAFGFEQLVAIKRPHPHLMQTPDLRPALLAEAQLASRIRHANVVGVRDVETEEDSVLLVMDYVEGASLHELLHSARTADRKTTIRAGLRVVRDLCAGLQAVHDLTDDEDRPLGAVHRDVSPQNVLVGVDGVSRLADFGIAKCLHAHDNSTNKGTLKGKFSYMAPEYMRGAGFDQRADVFAVGVMLWEILTQQRLFNGESHVDIIRKVMVEPVALVSQMVPGLGTTFDAIVDCALARDPAQRFTHASELAAALEHALADSEYAGTHEEVGRFVRAQIGGRLAERRRRIKEGLRATSSTRSSPVITLVVERDQAQAQERRSPSQSEEQETAALPSGTGPSGTGAASVSDLGSDEVRSFRPHRAVKVAIMSFGVVLVTALATLAIFTSRTPTPNGIIDEPRTPSASEAPATAAATSEAPMPMTSAPASTTLPPSSAKAPESVKATDSVKTPDSVKTADKPDKLEKPVKPRKVVSGSGASPAPTKSSDPAPQASAVARPRGNPY
ncbi:MAG TPA: protein kinase [Polyangiaceae bacterium]|nr:protein kinase [Polyangiaceae bacterium]